MTPVPTYVEIHRKKPDRLDKVNSWRNAVADVERLVCAITSPEVAAFRPADRIESFAFEGKFGPVDPKIAFLSIRKQLEHPRYVGARAVFPSIVLGNWIAEVIHPHPPGSTSFIGVFMSGDAELDDVAETIAAIVGMQPRVEGFRKTFETPILEVTVEPDVSSLSRDLEEVGNSRARRVWPALLGVDMAGFGTRLFPTESLFQALDVTNLLDLYGSVARAARPEPRAFIPALVHGYRALALGYRGWRGLVTLRGAHVVVIAAVPRDLEASDIDELLRELGSASSATDGYVQVERFPWGPGQGPGLGSPPPDERVILAESFSRVGGIQSLVRINQASIDGPDAGCWRWATIEPLDEVAD